MLSEIEKLKSKAKEEEDKKRIDEGKIRELEKFQIRDMGAVEKYLRLTNSTTRPFYDETRIFDKDITEPLNDYVTNGATNKVKNHAYGLYNWKDKVIPKYNKFLKEKLRVNTISLCLINIPLILFSIFILYEYTRKFQWSERTKIHVPLWLFYSSFSICIFSVVILFWTVFQLLFRNKYSCALPIYISQTLLLFILSVSCLVLVDRKDNPGTYTLVCFLLIISIIGLVSYYKIIKSNILRFNL